MSDEPSRRKLGQIVREARLRRGWSQERLAAEVGDNMTQADVSHLEIGRTKLPHRRRLDAIAAALGIAPGELLGASDWAKAEYHVEAPPSCINFPIAPASRRGQILADVAALTDEQLEIIWSVVDGIKRSKYGEERNGGPEPARHSTALGA